MSRSTHLRKVYLGFRVACTWRLRSCYRVLIQHLNSFLPHDSACVVLPHRITHRYRVGSCLKVRKLIPINIRRFSDTDGPGGATKKPTDGDITPPKMHRSFSSATTMALYPLPLIAEGRIGSSGRRGWWKAGGTVREKADSSNSPSPNEEANTPPPSSIQPDLPYPTFLVS